MALVEFSDQRGRRWRVWDVYPTLVERRRQNAGPPPGLRERRRLVEARLGIRNRMSSGWLTFEAHNGERRRLAPIPDVPGGWDLAPDHQLEAWLESAEPAPPTRRLIE